MSVPTATAHPRSRRAMLRSIGAALAVTLGVVLFVVLALQFVRTPEYVDLTVVNPTAYDVDVDVRNAGDDSVVGLGRVAHAEERRFEEVLDQGDVWVLEYSYGGVDAASAEVTREELERADWRVEVPPAVVTAFEEAELAPPPP